MVAFMTTRASARSAFLSGEAAVASVARPSSGRTIAASSGPRAKTRSDMEGRAVRAPGEEGGGFDDFGDKAVDGGGGEGGAEVADKVVGAGAEVFGRGA